MKTTKNLRKVLPIVISVVFAMAVLIVKLLILTEQMLHLLRDTQAMKLGLICLMRLTDTM